MKQQQVKEIAYLGKRVYFGNKPYTLVENEVKGMCQGCDLLGLLHYVLKDLYLREINNERGEEK